MIERQWRSDAERIDDVPSERIFFGAKIFKSSQLSRQADSLTPLKVIGDTHLVLSRGGTNLHLDALVVEDLDVELLAGTQFLVSNGISSRSAKSQITILLAKPLYTTVTRIPTAPSVTRFVELMHMCYVLLVLNTNTTHDTPVKFHDLFLYIVFAFHSPEGAQHKYSTIQYKSDRWNHRFS